MQLKLLEVVTLGESLMNQPRAGVIMQPFQEGFKSQRFQVIEIGSLSESAENPKIIIDLFAISKILDLIVREYQNYFSSFELVLSFRNYRKEYDFENDYFGFFQACPGGVTISIGTNFHLWDPNILVTINKIIFHEFVHLEQWYRYRDRRYGPKVHGYWEPIPRFWIGNQKLETEAHVRDMFYRSLLCTGEAEAFVLYIPSGYNQQFPINSDLAKIYWPELRNFPFAL